MALLILYTLAALGVSFLCSLLEAVLLSVSPSFVANLAQGGTRSGQLLRDQKKNMHRPLAAILTLNTIAHTVGAAGAGAQAQSLWGSEILALASAVLTLLILFLSEIIPKTLGAAYCNRLAPWAARTCAALVWIFRPFVYLSGAITGRVKVVEDEEVVDRRQIAALARLGQERGVLEPSEARFIGSIVQAGEVRVKDAMTPRTVLFSLSMAMPVKEAIEQRLASRFSRIPVWQDQEDELKGYVLKDELLLAASRGDLEKPIGEFKRPLLIFPESQNVVETFEQMLEKREHIALAVDEYGSIAGIATMEDILETILGCEIVDEADPVRDMRVLARRRWIDRARRLGIAADAEATESSQIDVQ